MGTVENTGNRNSKKNNGNSLKRVNRYNDIETIILYKIIIVGISK